MTHNNTYEIHQFIEKTGIKLDVWNSLPNKVAAALSHLIYENSKMKNENEKIKLILTEEQLIKINSST